MCVVTMASEDKTVGDSLSFGYPQLAGCRSRRECGRSHSSVFNTFDVIDISPLSLNTLSLCSTKWHSSHAYMLVALKFHTCIKYYCA